MKIKGIKVILKDVSELVGCPISFEDQIFHEAADNATSTVRIIELCLCDTYTVCILNTFFAFVFVKI